MKPDKQDKKLIEYFEVITSGPNQCISSGIREEKQRGSGLYTQTERRCDAAEAALYAHQMQTMELYEVSEVAIVNLMADLLTLAKKLGIKDPQEIVDNAIIHFMLRKR